MKKVFDITQKRYRGSESRKYLKDRLISARYFLERAGELNIKKGKRILDSGCGMGSLASLFIDDYEVHGIDLSKDGIKIAKERGIKAKVADLEEKWPYPSGKFDLVLSKQVIEHLLNPDKYLSEANRVLVPGGKLLLSTPNLASWFNRVIFIFGFQPFTLEASTVDKTIGLKFTRRLTSNRKPMGHIRGFTLKALEDILELHGFEIKKSVGGEVNYLPRYMNPFDRLFANFSSLASDLIVVAEAKK